MPLEGLNSLIKGLEKQPNWQDRRRFKQVITHWPKTVGYAVACKTKPVSLKRNVLYVAVASAAWAQTLGFERTRILRKLNKYLQSPLQDIRFSTAQWSQKSARPPITLSDDLKSHPSYIGNLVKEASPQIVKTCDKATKANREKTDIPRAPKTAHDAFQRWENLIRTQQKHQSACPQCQCQCPPGELKRWQVCALCAAKSWK